MDQEISEFMNNNDFFILSSAPVNEPEEVISINYNNTKNESNIIKQEPLNYLEKRINSIEKEVSKLNELMMYHYDEIMKNVYQITVKPRFFTKWASLPIQHASSIETFTVNETRYMIITSDSNEIDTKNVSVYKVLREGPKHSQTITLPGARTTKNLNFQGTVYIAVACDDSWNDKKDVHIYTWTNDETLKLLQTFNGAGDPTFGMTTSHGIYLALTKSDGEQSTKVHVYKWDHKDNQFRSIQFQETIRGVKPHFFNVKNHLWLSTSSKLSSTIYRWNELRSEFEVFQTIPVPSPEAMDLQPVHINRHFFLIATSLEGPALISYKLSDFREQFEKLQTMPALKVEALDSFHINSHEHFIAVVEAPNPSTDTKEVIIYKFSGATYNFFQSVTANNPSSVKVFHHLSGSSVMAVGNALSLDLFKWNDA